MSKKAEITIKVYEDEHRQAYGFEYITFPVSQNNTVAEVVAALTASVPLLFANANKECNEKKAEAAQKEADNAD